MKGVRALVTAVITASLGALIAVAPVSAAPEPVPSGVLVGLAPLPGSGPRSQTSAPKDAGPGSSCPRSKRAIADRPDLTEQPQVHVILLLSESVPDETIDTDGTLECSIRSMNEWLLEASNGLQWRLDLYKPGRGRQPQLDITYVRSGLPNDQLGNADVVSKELIARGFAQPNKRYLTYVVAGENLKCGDALYPIDDHSAEPVDMKYAQVYLNSHKACHARDFGTSGSASWSEAIAQQELMHNDGMTPLGSPRACLTQLPFPAHVCTPMIFVDHEQDPERFDIMFPYANLPLRDKRLDPGNDDYFRHSLPIRDFENSLYLESNR